MAFQKRPDPIITEINSGAWMMTFSDLLTLLLAFFVLLLTMSSMDDRKFRDAFGMFSGAFGTLAKQSEAGMSPDFIVPISAPVPEILVADLNDMLDRTFREKSEKPKEKPEIPPEPEQYKHLFEVERVANGIVIRVAGAVLFEPGSAQLTRSAVELLGAVGLEVAFTHVPLRVESFVPPTDDNRDAAWTLSLERASNVASELARVRNLDAANLSLMGYGRQAPRTLRLDRERDIIVLRFFTPKANDADEPEGADANDASKKPEQTTDLGRDLSDG